MHRRSGPSTHLPLLLLCVACNRTPLGESVETESTGPAPVLPLPPEPSLCDDLPEGTDEYEGVFRIEDDGVIKLHASSPSSTCEELVGCVGWSGGDYLTLDIEPPLDSIGGHPIENYDFEPGESGPIVEICGRCIMSQGSGTTGCMWTVDGHVELTTFTDDELSGCVLDASACHAVRFSAKRCD